MCVQNNVLTTFLQSSLLPKHPPELLLALLSTRGRELIVQNHSGKHFRFVFSEIKIQGLDADERYKQINLIKQWKSCFVLYVWATFRKAAVWTLLKLVATKRQKPRFSIRCGKWRLYSSYMITYFWFWWQLLVIKIVKIYSKLSIWKTGAWYLESFSF